MNDFKSRQFSSVAPEAYMIRSSFKTNDDVAISYSYGQQLKVHSTTCLVLIHGFSGSSLYFDRNVPELRKEHTVIVYDLRGHGEPDRPTYGYHVSRLAADLHQLLAEFKHKFPQIRDFVGIGCSIGAAVLWSYVELFGEDPFSKMVFVDQAPLQNYAPGWGPDLGNYGCHDVPSLASLQSQWYNNRTEAAKDLVRSCLGYRFKPEQAIAIQVPLTTLESDEVFFTEVSSKCDVTFLSKLSTCSSCRSNP